MYLSLEKKEFTEEKIKGYEEESISSSGEEGKGMLEIKDDSGKFEIDGIDDDGFLHIVNEDSNLGYISVDVKLDNEDMIKITEIMVKKLNKFKNILESLK